MSCKNIISNFHTHTYLCGHAYGKPIDYLDNIKNCNVKIMGFSDHAYIDIPSFKHIIKSPEEMDIYYNDVLELKKVAPCEILVGLEIDYFPSFTSYYQKLKAKYDYLSLSIHFVLYKGSYSYGTRFSYLEELSLYCDYMEQGMKSGLFSFVNHPDLFLNDFMNEYKDSSEIINFEEKIITFALKYDMPLELNIAQCGRYRHLYENNNIRDMFWKMVGKHQAKVLINYDSHNPDFFNPNYYDEALKYAKQHNLNVVYDFRKRD